MANITILQAPQSYSPAFNPHNWVVISTNRTQPNFKYVCDVIINGQTFRQTRYPHPTYGTGVFSVDNIIKNYISAVLNTNAGFQQNGNIVDYTCAFGEEYGYYSSGTTVYPNQASSGVISWGASLDNRDFPSYNQYNYFPSSGDGILTNSPQSGVIRDDENAWLCGLNYYFTSFFITNQARVITYDSSNNIIQQVVVNNPYGVSTQNYTSNKIFRFPAGTRNLNLIESSGIISGAQPIITASVARYSIQFELVTNQVVSDVKWYKIDNECTNNETYRLHFLNKLGGWDSFTFIRGHKRKYDIKKKEYKRIQSTATSTGYSYSNDDFSALNYSTSYDEMVNITSDWISEATYEWLAELVTSPVVYLDDSTYGLVAITITGNSYEFKTLAQDKLFNLTIDFKYSSDSSRQSL